MRRLTNETFLTRAKIVHGDFYQYPDVYTKKRISIKISCPLHGEFMQLPLKHLQGQGCFQCGVLKRAQSQSTDHDSFVVKACLIHNDKYEYGERYRHSRHKLKITCKSHGAFWQTPSNHLVGHGCPRCKSLTRLQYLVKKTPTIPCRVYLLRCQCENEKFLKIGITTHTVAFRYRESKYHRISFDIILQKMIPLKQAIEIEEQVKCKFSNIASASIIYA